MVKEKKKRSKTKTDDEQIPYRAPAPRTDIGPSIRDISHSKRLKGAWKEATKGNMPLKIWARSIIDAGEPESVVEYAMTWFDQKSLACLSRKKFLARQ